MDILQTHIDDFKKTEKNHCPLSHPLERLSVNIFCRIIFSMSTHKYYIRVNQNNFFVILHSALVSVTKQTVLLKVPVFLRYISVGI